jgi:hypothetical protein
MYLNNFYWLAEDPCANHYTPSSGTISSPPKENHIVVQFVKLQRPQFGKILRLAPASLGLLLLQEKSPVNLLHLS